MIRSETITLSAAELGALNPLPDIMNNTYIHAGYEMTDAVSPKEAENIGKGMIPTMLPYLTQDGYSREREDRKLPAVVLENSFLRAVFLPSMGGRLWQLWDKTEQRDLIYVNPVLQPCNLALRNAWFSGGVEFNVGIKGHNPLTCSPLFARIATDGEGNEVLSMYEFERIRGIAFSIHAWLPEDSRVLYVKNVIENTAPTPTYMYWWTNIAIPKTDQTRILVPTSESFVSLYDADHYILDSKPIPNAFGTDVSYPSNLNRSMDYFYKLPDDSPKWIASADENGQGLLHFSESILKGRKLFLWGQGNGGKHWGEFLADAEPHSGEGYLEIQAGLARTQLEHFIMPQESTLQWTECFTALRGAPDALHGDWETAQRAVSESLLACTNGQTPDDFLKGRFPALSKLKNGKKVHEGSGWGRLENKVRQGLGLSPISSLFDDWETTLTAETDLFEALLEKKEVTESSPLSAPVSYINQLPYHDGLWTGLLRQATERDPSNSVLLNQYGVTLYAAGMKDEAETCWRRAADQGNPYAWRNLAAYHYNECGNKREACDEIVRARTMLPNSLAISREYGSMLCGCGDVRWAQSFLDQYDALPTAIREDARMLLWKVRALLLTDRAKDAALILTPDFLVADIKEGELSFSALWFEMTERLVASEEGISREEAGDLARERYPLPYTLDFRMHE